MQTKTTIPTDWKLVKLGEVIRLEYGKPLPDPKRKLDGAYPVYGANGEKMRTDEYYYDKKSIIVGRKGSVGELNLTSEKFWPLDVTYYVVFESKKCDLMFLYELLRTLNLPKLAAGVKPGLNRNEVYSIDAKIPPLPEQEKIVKVLEAWDSYLEKLTNTIKCKKTIKNSLMRELLEGKIRIPGFSNKWEMKPLSFYVDLELRPVPKPETKFKALGIRSHCKGTFQKLDFDPSKIAMDTLYEVQKDDLIVNITFAWEGAIAIVKKNDEGGLVSHRFPTYTFKNRVSNADYFKQFIQSKRFRHLLKLISPGGAGRNRVLSKKDFLKLKIQIPDYEEQTAIANILTTVDCDIEALEKKKMLVEQQKKFLLNNLITGRIRLPEFIH